MLVEEGLCVGVGVFTDGWVGLKSGCGSSVAVESGASVSVKVGWIGEGVNKSVGVEEREAFTSAGSPAHEITNRGKYENMKANQVL